jgi:AAA domain
MATAPDNIASLEKRAGIKVQPAPEEPPIKLLAFDLEAILKPIPPERHLIVGMPCEAYTLIAGALSSYKSTLLLYMLILRATGYDFLNLDKTMIASNTGAAALVFYEDTDKRVLTKFHRILQSGYAQIEAVHGQHNARRFLEMATQNIRRICFTGCFRKTLVTRIEGTVFPNEPMIEELLGRVREFTRQDPRPRLLRQHQRTNRHRWNESERIEGYRRMSTAMTHCNDSFVPGGRGSRNELIRSYPPPHGSIRSERAERKRTNGMNPPSKASRRCGSRTSADRSRLASGEAAWSDMPRSHGVAGDDAQSFKSVGGSRRHGLSTAPKAASGQDDCARAGAACTSLEIGRLPVWKLEASMRSLWRDPRTPPSTRWFPDYSVHAR